VRNLLCAYHHEFDPGPCLQVQLVKLDRLQTLSVQGDTLNPGDALRTLPPEAGFQALRSNPDTGLKDSGS
jgi:hypothetical protein